MTQEDLACTLGIAALTTRISLVYNSPIQDPMTKILQEDNPELTREEMNYVIDDYLNNNPQGLDILENWADSCLQYIIGNHKMKEYEDSFLNLSLLSQAISDYRNKELEQEKGLEK